MTDSILAGIYVRANDDGLVCITDYLDFFKSKYHIYGIFTSNLAIKAIEDMYSIRIDRSKVITCLKRHKLWKTTGARHTKAVFVDLLLGEFIVSYINKSVVFPRYIRDEQIFYKMLTDFFPDEIIITQKNCVDFFIDFFIEKYNLAIEFDETHHNSKGDLDTYRQKEIQSYLKCDFIRVKVDEEIQGLRTIYDYILKHN